jgi:hypothetical protein
MTGNSYKRFIRDSTRFSFYAFWFVAVLIGLSAAIDVIFNIGWGYRLIDVVAAIGITSFSILVYLFIRVIFRVIDFGKF